MTHETPRRALMPKKSGGPSQARRLWLITLAALLVLGLAYSMMRVLKDNGSAAQSPGPSGSVTPSCAGSSQVVVDPSWAPALTAASDAYKATASDGCPAIAITATPDETVLAKGLGNAQAWVPEDPSVAGANAQLAQAQTTVVASSPLVLVAQQQVQTALGSRTLSGTTLAALASGSKTWNDVVAKNWGPLRLVLPNPATNVAGAVGFQTIALTVAGGGTPTTDLTAIQSHLQQMAQVQYKVAQTVNTPAEVLQHLAAVASDDTGRGAAGPRVGVTTQYALLASNQKPKTLAATPLAGGGAGVQLAVVNPGADKQVAGFVTWLKSDAGQKALAAAGLTTATAKPSAAALAAVALPASLPMSVSPNAASTLAQARQMYQGFSVRMATTTVLDASGSMGNKLPGSNLRKIDLVAQASAGTWSQWPDGSASALFTFNTNSAGDARIKLLVPWIVAGQPGSAATMQRYASQLGGIPVGGGTPLYQAIWTGYTYALQHYQKGKLNQVIVVTDGYDQDAKENITLPQLMAKLKAADRTRPIKMRYVALGPSADYATLEAIARKTGGTAAWATDPNNLPQVMQQIMAS